jgi:hypothetical protein
VDGNGRAGISVGIESRDAHGVRMELIFDRDSYQLLADRAVVVGRVDWIEARPGTVIGETLTSKREPTRARESTYWLGSRQLLEGIGVPASSFPR